MNFIQTLATGMLAATIALAGHAHAGTAAAAPEPAMTAQKKLEEREAKRQAEIAEQARKKEEFARRCVLPLVSPVEVEACRALYRQM